MPMLHGCAFPGCPTLTLSAYCVEHELLMRASKESEHGRSAHALRIEDDAPLPVAAEAEAHERATL
jgi:hypothetical protein